MDKVEIVFSKKFIKSYQKTPLKIRTSLKKRLAIFEKTPFSPVLNNHPLRGIYKNYRSINITGDWRAIYRPEKSGKKAIFKLIGTHSQLYK